MNYARIALDFKLQLEFLKADLICELRRRYGEDEEKWRRVLRASLTWPNVPKHQRAAMMEVLKELERTVEGE